MKAGVRKFSYIHSEVKNLQLSMNYAFRFFLNSQARTGTEGFSCSADHEQDWQPYPVDLYSAICDDHAYIHTYITVLLLPLHFIKGPFINSNTAALSFAVWSYLPPDNTMQSSCLVTTLSSGSRDRESHVIWPKGQGDLSICCGKKKKI